MCLLLSHLLHVACLRLDSSMVLQMALVHFFHQRIFHLYMEEFFFVHPPVGGLFGYFHFVAIVIRCNADLPASVFPILSFQIIGRGVGLLDHMVAQCFPFQSTYIVFSLVALNMPPLTTKGTHFSTIPSAFIFCSIFANGHSDCCKLIGICNMGMHVVKYSKIHHFSTPFSFLLKEKRKKKCEYNICLESVFLERCPLLNFLVNFQPQDCFEMQVSFTGLQ